MIENIREITKDQLLNEVQNMMYENYRFDTVTCMDNGNESFDIIYHFDRDLELKNYRLKVSYDEEIPSISRIYFCAVLVENEIKELFGVKVTNIVLDYGGHLLLSDKAQKTPMAKHQITIERRNDNA
jgi:NADH:ubiquinone oxidoreductase subunit C